MPSPSPLRPESGRLDRAELRELVTRLAAEPARWRPLARPEAAERHFELLERDGRVEVWVISWADGSDTGFHDHDTSDGAVAVVEGELVEERLVVGGPARDHVHRAGDAFSFDASHVHRMRQNGAGAVSIHAYSPPLTRMGAYSWAADGTLQRRAIPAEEELRPAAVA
jgi:quercetin dioxygenase-like cupin family protein